MSTDPSTYTWEDILRAVTMPGRPDRLYHLQHQWYKTLQVLDVVSKALRKIRSQVDDDQWTGPGADAYRKHFDTMIRSIDKLYADASAMMDIAETLGVNLASAISAIPCPNWSTAHNKSWDDSWQYYIDVDSANDHGGEAHYQYFTEHPDRYNTHGIKSYFQYWMQQRPITNNFTGTGQSYYESGGQQQLDSWYATNTTQARNAFSSLISTYQDCHRSMPELSEDKIDLDPAYSSRDSHNPPNWTADSATSGYDTSKAGSGSTVIPNSSSGLVPHHSTSNPSRWPETSSYEGANPHNGEQHSGTSLAGSSPSSLPDSQSVHRAGSWGDGPTADLGSSSDYGQSSVIPPVNRANVGQPGLPNGVSDAAAAQKNSAYGAIPSSGTGRGSKDKETRQTWLTEDENFFAAEDPGPPAVIDQDYMNELDERDRRRGDWW